jgi:hypothetical protein
MSTLNRQPSCTCPPGPGQGTHTSWVNPSITDEDLRVLIGMETCPVEVRALERILIARHHRLVQR